MYAYIKGLITEITNNYVVVENNGVGYLIYIANPSTYKLNSEMKIYLYQHIKEDENTLYGFSNKEDKNLFLKLINVKGVGCKMALGMFSSNSNHIIEAIELEDISYLKKFPKIGEKVARQIILDLKGKLVSAEVVLNNVNNEVVEALKALGYKQAEINKVLENIDLTLSVNDQIKQSLKMMLK